MGASTLFSTDISFFQNVLKIARTRVKVDVVSGFQQPMGVMQVLYSISIHMVYSCYMLCNYSLSFVSGNSVDQEPMPMISLHYPCQITLIKYGGQKLP